MVCESSHGQFGKADAKLIKSTRRCLPDDVIHVIFSKLDFRDNITAGLVCKQWDQLLKSVTAAGKHWVVDYNVDAVEARETSKLSSSEPSVEPLTDSMERYVLVPSLFKVCTRIKTSFLCARAIHVCATA